MNSTKCHFDFATLPWLTSPRRQLELYGVAIGIIRLPPNEGYTFTHHHRKQEEVYIFIEGSGQVPIDNDLAINVCRSPFINPGQQHPDDQP